MCRGRGGRQVRWQGVLRACGASKWAFLNITDGHGQYYVRILSDYLYMPVILVFDKSPRGVHAQVKVHYQKTQYKT